MGKRGISALLEAAGDADARGRRAAVRELCPCRIKRNDAEVWDRVLAMTADPDRGVRSAALHALIDGSPRARRGDVLRALESLRGDPDPRLRRHARKILARHRATGKVNLH